MYTAVYFIVGFVYCCAEDIAISSASDTYVNLEVEGGMREALNNCVSTEVARLCVLRISASLLLYTLLLLWG